ncbi:hypothetical protein V6Z11_D06G044400 [Gossypium hirsutum]
MESGIMDYKFWFKSCDLRFFRVSFNQRPLKEDDLMAAATAQGMDPTVLDDIIRRPTEVRSARPGKQVQLSESEIKQLCVASKDIFVQQPNLLELEAPIKICEFGNFWR